MLVGPNEQFDQPRLEVWDMGNTDGGGNRELIQWCVTELLGGGCGANHGFGF